MIDIEQAKNLYLNKGMTLGEVAHFFNTNYEAVIQTLHSISIVRTKKVSVNLTQLKYLWESDNYTIAELAKHFNVSIPTIKRRLRKIKARHRYKWNYSHENPINQRIIKLYTNDHLSTKDMEQVKRCVDLYKNKKLSSNQNGRVEGISGSKVLKLLRFAKVRIRQRTGISTTVKKRALRIYKTKNHLYKYLKQCRRCERLYRKNSQGSRICPKCSRSNHRAFMQSPIHSNNSFHSAG